MEKKEKIKSPHTLGATRFQTPFCREANAIRRGRVLRTVKLYTRTGGKHPAGVTQTSSGSSELMLKRRRDGDPFPTQLDLCMSLISPVVSKNTPAGRQRARQARAGGGRANESPAVVS